MSVQASVPSVAARELISRVAARIEPRVGEIAARLVEQVLAEMDFVADDVRLRGEFEAGALEKYLVSNSVNGIRRLPATSTPEEG